MRRSVRLLSASLLAFCVWPMTLSGDDAVTPWEEAYQGADAIGAHVLGLWKFDDDQGMDASGKNPQGMLRNGKFTAMGKFGGALESFSGFPEADRSHGFLVPNHPRLSPHGAFTLELWIHPKSEFAQRDWAVLIDKKYAGHDDYQLAFGAADGKRQRRLTLSLGFGSETQNFLSDAGDFPAGEWSHLAVTYDGKGKVRFFRNGTSFGVAEGTGRGAISAGAQPLSIGDRLGSNFPGFPGYLDEVRLTSGIREFGQLRVTTLWPRKAFVRFEEPPRWTVSLRNLTREPVNRATLTVAVGDLRPREYALPEIPPGKVHQQELTFNTQLRPDHYEVVVTASTEKLRVRESGSVTLVPRPLPERMPVVMWGIGGVKEVLTELPRLKRLGFTHCFGGEVDHQRIAAAKEPTLVTKPENMPAAIEMMDTALAHDLQILGATWPGYFEPVMHEYIQTGRGGTPLKRRTLTPNAPAVMEAFARAGESVAKTYAEHPAFSGMLVNSEVRDDSEVSFTGWDQAAYRREFGAGTEIPAWVNSKYPPNYASLKDFPANRVVSGDHPQLAFYRWWWSHGDGWNPAHSAVHHGLHRGSARPDLWTFYDPVVRCPPLWGSGGDVDVLSQWTYTDPDPLRMSLPVDELFAMAGGREPRARVMKMTQLFWYRSTTAPAESSPREGSNPATWADQDPNTSFISIHPLHLRESFWTKIARPIEGIMYHGWSSLVPTDGSHAYKYTHPQLQQELTRLTHDVVAPLGATLRQVPAVRSDIAFLESFTTFAFTSKSTWGYAGGWQADAYFALQHARLQPEVIYEQHLLRDGLDPYRVLVMVDCEVLTQDVVDRVLKFQRRGGLIIGDDRLCPVIKADFVLPTMQRTKIAKADKAKLLELAETIREWIDGKSHRTVDTSSPNVIPHRRRFGSTDYIFLVNDAREAGDYVGQYERVEELGMPTSTEVQLTGSVGAVYDLVTHQPVPFRRTGTGIVVPVELGPCDGRVWMATAAPIAGLRIEGPDQGRLTESWSGKVSVVDANGKAIDAVVPLQVEILDADGRVAERSGYYGAQGGELMITLDLAENDQPGIWEIRVHDLASGLRQSRFVRIIRD